MAHSTFYVGVWPGSSEKGFNAHFRGKGLRATALNAEIAEDAEPAENSVNQAKGERQRL